MTNGRGRQDFGANQARRETGSGACWQSRLLLRARWGISLSAGRSVGRLEGCCIRIVLQNCCGLDVHKDTITACLLVADQRGRVRKEKRTFGTKTADLLVIMDWLLEAGCTHLGMESTGVYWKPIYNLFEGTFELTVANARHMKAVPGRKTDQGDAEWIADLLMHGLLPTSFIPSRELRELRELIRYRKALVQMRTMEANRIQKVLEGANIKLGSVASDLQGVSAQGMLRAMVEGTTDPKALAQMARGRLKKKAEELEKALDGSIAAHQRFLLGQIIEHMDFLNKRLEACDQQIEELMNPLTEDVALLDTIPGVDRKTAQLILSEIGPEMSRFPTHKHLASWAGLCPGNNESAGKRRSGKTSKGSRWLKAGLVEAAWAAIRSRKTYLSALYYRLKARRGPAKAVVAVAHAILVAVYHILKTRTQYQELGPSFFDQVNRQRVASRLQKRLQALGYTVTLESAEPDPPAA